MNNLQVMLIDQEDPYFKLHVQNSYTCLALTTFCVHVNSLTAAIPTTPFIHFHHTNVYKLEAHIK